MKRLSNADSLRGPVSTNRWSEHSVPNERRQSLHVFAISVAVKSQALARTFRWSADADVVHVAQAESVHAKGAATDGARDFSEHVERGLAMSGEGEQTEITLGGGAQKTNAARRELRHGYSLLYLSGSTEQSPRLTNCAAVHKTLAVLQDFASIWKTKETHHGQGDFQG
jgi:hypothetical protein